MDGAGKFCTRCGKGAGDPLPPAGAARLMRAREGKKIAGVCAGFARYMDVDVTLVRIAWLLIALTAGVGVIAYIVAWIAMPREVQLNRYPEWAVRSGAFSR